MLKADFHLGHIDLFYLSDRILTIPVPLADYLDSTLIFLAVLYCNAVQCLRELHVKKVGSHSEKRL